MTVKESNCAKISSLNFLASVFLLASRVPYISDEQIRFDGAVTYFAFPAGKSSLAI
jgi:hypothetical protein